MLSTSWIILGLSGTLSIAASNPLPDLLHRDVVVIGGGASGAYAAVRLRDDFDKSIALIEKQSILVRSKP
jgi:ribulose 1,5-bisphosphate synthetase/thiazole synthase